MNKDAIGSFLGKGFMGRPETLVGLLSRGCGWSDEEGSEVLTFDGEVIGRLSITGLAGVGPVPLVAVVDRLTVLTVTLVGPLEGGGGSILGGDGLRKTGCL